MNVTAIIESNPLLNSTSFTQAERFRHGAAAGSSTIYQVIQSTAETVDDQELRPLAPGVDHSLVQARAMLVLLVNCYTHQIYSSTAAIRLLECDPAFPAMWWEEPLDPQDLRRFRLENCAVIQQCLEAALYFRAKEKILAGFVTKVNGPQLAEEARRRITMAAFADSMELEGE